MSHKLQDYDKESLAVRRVGCWIVDSVDILDNAAMVCQGLYIRCCRWQDGMNDNNTSTNHQHSGYSDAW